MKKLLKRHKADTSASASNKPPEERYGLFSLHEAHNADIDIVAVHGLGGHFKDTWTDDESKQLWLRDFLPSQLKEAGDSQNESMITFLSEISSGEEENLLFAGITARIMSYGYDSTTAFSKSVTDIEDQATILIDTLSLERWSPSEKSRPLVFIAHSLGGIIVKKAMIIAHERSNLYGTVLDSVHALVLFGVPHRGSDLAYWSTLAARLLNTVQLGSGTNTSFVEALKRNSQAFADISQSFIERAAPLKIRTFYETEKLYGNLIVDKDSARLGLPNEIPVGVAAADHRTICKFNDKDSQRYRPVWKAIQALCVKTEEVTASTRKQPESLFIVPFTRDPLFFGREDVIAIIDTKFKSERRVALTGIGGIGKSQVAIEYCYRFKDRHADSNIFWVHAGTKERFEQAFKAIAKKCKLPGWDDPATNPLDLVYDWLSGDTTWLMILDNADDKDVFFDQRPTANSQIPEAQRSSGPLITYLPQTSRGGSVLITSRNRDVAFRLTDSVKNLIDVPYMSKEDAVALLCKKLPDDQSSDEEKFELVELLEYLPLAITQAASYISAKRTRMTIARYSNILRKNEDILLRDMGDLRRDPTIPSSVLLTWHISFDQINEENRPAAELLFLMSVLDRQGIPQYLFQNEDKDDLDFENRLAPLEEFSLITLEDSDRSFQMHRLVQMAIRSWLERHGEIDRWKQSAAELVAENLPIAEYPFWKTWEILLPHSEVTLDYVSSSMKSQLVHVRILHHTACYFIERGRYDAARERCQRALDIQQDLLPEDDIRVAHSLSTLATLKYFSGDDRRIDIDEAEALSRRAVDIFERVQGKDHYNSMGARNTLAFTLLDTGHDRKIQEATEILRSILASKEQSLGLEHLETLESMNSLALALAMQHRYDEAEKLYRITLQTSFRRHGEDHPRTITSMENLAFLLNNRKKYEEAQDFAQRALDLRMRVLGEEHPHTLSTMILLSGILSSQGEAGEAEGLCRYALALHKTVFGSGASKTMECTYTLGQILANQHKYAEAEELFREVYNNRPRGWNDKVWNLFLDEFADTVAKQGKHDEAAEISSQRIPSEDEGSYLSNTSVTESPPQTRNASPTESLLEVPEIRRRMTA